MGFGKPGRPPEDRLARQQEIYEAVAPLLLSVGWRGLTMQQAAQAACMSIGGLYHYFPTKRDLVLHGLDLQARDRLCREYREACANLARWSIDQGIEAYLDHSIKMFAFVRPSARAAFEMGLSELQTWLDQGLTANVEELMEALRVVVDSTLGDEERAMLGRAIRRSLLGTMLDVNVDMSEVRDQLRLLISGYLSRASEMEELSTPA